MSENPAQNRDENAERCDCGHVAFFGAARRVLDWVTWGSGGSGVCFSYDASFLYCRCLLAEVEIHVPCLASRSIIIDFGLRFTIFASLAESHARRRTPGAAAARAAAA